MRLDDDIQAYLQRLQVEAEPPSAAALVRLHHAQLERIPYETTWIHLGERWTIDLEESVHRVATRGRGGYCFHVNGAFSVLLRSLGYDVTLHAGGVHGPEGPTPDAIENHLVLLVHGLPTDGHPEGTWYVDAGLGDAIHGPLPLSPGAHRHGPFEFHLARTDLGFADWSLRHHHLGSFTGMVFERMPTTIDRFAARNVELFDVAGVGVRQDPHRATAGCGWRRRRPWSGSEPGGRDGDRRAHARHPDRMVRRTG